MYVIYQSDFKTAIGRLYYLWRNGAGASGTEEGAALAKIKIIYLGTNQESLIAYLKKIKGAPGHPENYGIVRRKSPEIERKINLYLENGRLVTGIEPEFLSGSKFEKKIWDTACGIPSGTTISYGRLAGMAGFPSAARAAGSALGRNPVIIIVPCHRVIRNDGSMGGFSSGKAIKEKLLRIEAAVKMNI
ncbi:MAG: MGMT family protein [Actinobacteria bacterium]|nr:MGMT family protein [Actinomycetota bacterium]